MEPKSGWTISIVLYTLFAILVFLTLGERPLLGPDHVSYFNLADTIRSARPGGDYWHELDSVRVEGVLLAYLFPLTDSHVQSMKLILSAMTLAYLLTFELLMQCFTNSKWKAMLFTLLGGFAVSFGVGSWGVTDSTAMLNRTFVMPAIFLVLRFYLKNFASPWRYLSFPLLVFAALLHLSAYHFFGLLLVIEAWDWLMNRKRHYDRMLAFMAGALLLTGITQVFVERIGLSANLTGFVTASVTAAPTFTTPVTTSGANHGKSTLSTAWQTELELRPWRNMPLPLANLANIFSSYAVIFLLAMRGIVVQRKNGFTLLDRQMLALFAAIPLVAFGPQTLLWILRNHLPVPPINFEEIRTISFIMIPSIYFVFRLFESATHHRNRYIWGGAVAIAFLILPLSMKSLPAVVRESILTVAVNLKLVDALDPSQVQNARYALGIAYDRPYYYSTLGVQNWLSANPTVYQKLLSDRDELILLNRPIIGPRQIAAAPTKEVSDRKGALLSQAFFDTRAALETRDLAAVFRIARRYGADVAVVPWSVPDALYRDEYFSLVRVAESVEALDLTNRSQ